MIQEVLFYVIVLLTNIVQCITGFAGTVLAMPFSIMLIGYDKAKPILNILGIVVSAVIVASNFKKINKKEFLKITGVMAVCIFADFFIGRYFLRYESLMYKTLGVIVILFALINAVKFYSKKTEKELSPVLMNIILVLSGFVHGIFVCGGPLLVTYASAKLKDKDEFRSTLSAVWVVLNTLIMFEDISSGYFNKELLIMLAISVIILIAAIKIGNILCRKMSKNVFLQITYVLMFISGVSLLIK